MRDGYIATNDYNGNVMKFCDMKDVDEQRTYNCGGYALGLNTWFIPVPTDTFVTMNFLSDKEWKSWEERWDMEQEAEDVSNAYFEESFSQILPFLQKTFKDTNIDELYDDYRDIYYDSYYNNSIGLALCIEFMLKGMGDKLRRIKDWTELKNNEYGIVFAVSDDDFHYVKYDQLNNTYSHKYGSCSIETLKDYESGFPQEYNSERIFLAMKREMVA